jgi:hypothetical protein
MNAREEVCLETGASLVITLHYSKGNKANTQTGERSRGSSVFMGDVDAAIEFVAQQDADESNNILAVEAVKKEVHKLKKHGFLEQKFGRFRNWFLNLPSYSIWQQALQGLLPKFSKYRNL